MYSDYVYVIQNGMISEDGTFKSLKEEKTSYLYKLLNNL